MTRQVAIIVLLATLITTACMTPALVTVTPEATPLPTLAPISVSNTAVIYTVETCTFIAVTDTNIRECGGTGCAVVGEIKQGETVQAVCTDSPWARVQGGFVCVAAMIGTGGCE